MKHPYLRIIIIAASILAISALHYLTPLHLHYLHDIFQRFYYIPIILSALWFGLRGGLTSAIIVSIVYAPHIMLQWGGHVTMEMEKYLEIVLYNIVGALTGLLSQREQEKSEALQQSNLEQDEAYKKLRAQSERIISIEEELRRSEKLATLGEMAAVLAHEIRNPLGSIRGTAEILKDDYPANSAKHEFIEIQIKETERLNNVVEEFLRMAKQTPPVMKPCPLAMELETIATILDKDAAKGGVEIKLNNINPALMIKGDPEKLRQAFLNILINAIHAAASNNNDLMRGEIDVSAGVVGDFCEIYIKDNGTGMDVNTMNQVFDPFFTTKDSGTGLGLAITKKLITAHGGEISVSSSPGNGSCFTIKLPLWPQ